MKEKKQVLNNLHLIKNTLVEAENEGMPDPGEEIYNRITDLIEDTEAVEIPLELEEIILQGQDLEKDLDLYLSREGRLTLGLNWPKIS